MSSASTNKADLLANELVKELSLRGTHPNDQMPSVRELARKYDVCKHTVSVAISRLVAQGLLRQEQGRGTFVSEGVGGRASVEVSDIMALQTSIPDSYAGSDECRSGFIGEVIRGASAAAGRFKQLLVVRHRTDGSEALDVSCVERQLGHGLRGLVAEYAPGMYDMVALKSFAKRANLVFFNNENPEFETHFVSTDNVEAGRLAACHLIETGRRRIGFLSWRPGVSSIADRLSGYRIALAAAGIAYDETLVELRLKDLPAEDFNIPECLRALVAGCKADAVICINDGVQRHVCRILLEMGLRIPEDIAVAGFDNSAFGNGSPIPLTVVTQDSFQIGFKAASLAAGPRLDSIQRVLLKPALIRRASA